MKHNKIRILAVAIILSLSVLVLPGTPALAAPLIAVSPTSGAIGTMVTVTGTNFDSYKGDEISIFFDNVEITDSPIVVPETGSFSFNFNIPDSAEPGEHSIRARSKLGSTLARSLFTIPPAEIRLDTEAGTVGAEVTIDGKGFYVDKIVTFYYEDGIEAKLGIEVATANGEFSYGFTIPDSTAGRHTIVAENAPGDYAEAELEVIPSVALNLTSGAVSELLTISGTGFGYRRDVAIYFKDTAVTYAKTSEYGNFSTAFNVPAMPVDTYNVKAVDGDGNTDKAEFTIVTGASLSQTTGNVGTELTVTGTGFIASGTVTIKYGDVVIGTVNTNSTGAFTAIFKVPVSKSGNHIITASDGVNTKQLTFAMEWKAPPLPVLLLPGNTSAARAETYFDWGDVNDPSPPVTYRLQVASDKKFTSIILEKWLTDSEYTLPKEERLVAVKREAPYYWRVKAIDGAANESEWSVPRSFYVAVPPAPALLLPETGVKAEVAVYFDWEDVTDLSPPITYNLQIASDENFTSIVLEKWLADSEYTLPKEEKLAAVKKEAPYYWRVKAIDSAANESEWSAPGSFYIGFSFALPGWAIYTLIGLGVLIIGFLAFWLGRRTAYHQSYS